MADDSVRKTISLQPEVYRIGEENARRRGFAQSFSAYVAWLIQRDTEGAVVREDIAPGNAPHHPNTRPVNYREGKRKR